jgi:prevent-host-death family protein
VEAASDLQALLHEVRETGEPVMISGESGDDAVLISVDEYRQIARMKERAWEVVREIRERNADQDPDEIYRDVTRAVEEVRRERNARRSG